MNIMIKSKNYYKVLFIIFFLTYFSISVANIYVMTFIPFYFLEVINVDRSSLAFIKILISVPLLLPIFTGYLYDRYITNVKKLNLIFSTFFTISFLVFLINPQNLILFGAFYSINLISQFMIRGGMTKIFMALTLTNKPHYSESIRAFRIRRKNKFLLIINIGSILGSALTAIVSIFISNLREQSDWNVFFLFGFLFSLPIFISSILFQKFKLPCIDYRSNYPIIMEKTKLKKKIYKLKDFSGFIPLILLYGSYFLTDASLVSMLYMSWFSGRFGDEFIRIAFIFFPVSYILMMIGNLLVVRYLNKFRMPKYRKNKNLECAFFITGISSQIVVVLLIILLKNPFIVFFLYFTLLPFLGPIETLSKASMSQKISQEGKSPTFRMQFLSTANTLGSMIFSPIGLMLSTIVTVDYLIVIHLGFYGFSFVPFLLSSRISDKNKLNNEKKPSIILFEKIEAVEKNQYS